MAKTVLWIDDSVAELDAGLEMLRQMDGISGRAARSSAEAQEILERFQVDAVVTDVLRRHPNGAPAEDDGFDFFRAFIRPRFPRLPVIFHTKNAAWTIETDEHSQYLAKWDPPGKKAIELEMRLSESVSLYEAFADWTTWNRIEPRLVQLQSHILAELRRVDDIWQLTPDQFEQLVGELLQKLKMTVLWVPGGKDGGVDIVAGTGDHEFLIDVKRYRSERPVTVELVRRVYGVAESVGPTRADRIVHGGIITSSRFTDDAEQYRSTLRRRPLLRDGDWLKAQLSQYAPRIRRGAG